MSLLAGLAPHTNILSLGGLLMVGQRARVSAVPLEHAAELSLTPGELARLVLLDLLELMKSVTLAKRTVRLDLLREPHR